VLGAGAAGLSAAAVLARSGCSVLILEARDRIGGRILTLAESSLPHPVQLGAEFIHGSAPATFEILREAGLNAVGTTGERVTAQDGAADRRESFFDDLSRLMQRVDALGDADLSVEDFLALQAGDPTLEAACARARMMVEGFDAADPRRASVRAIAREWTEMDAGQYRPAGGYGELLAHLAHTLDAAGARLKLQTRVEAVAWSAGEVRIAASSAGGPFRVAARRALVTFPASVLQLAPGAPGAVRFDPPLDEKAAALSGVAVGPVIKVVLRFIHPFWERLHGGRFEHTGFLHNPRCAFPTVWTALPDRVPLLTAWMGGPRAAQLSGAPASDLVRRALESVRTLLGTGPQVGDELCAAYVHDWQQDPYALGAYSYVTVGGIGAADELARPLGERLYFAGEATCRLDPGTVEAALQSGRRAAGQILESLRADASR
jgi:monoamine oxidase